MRFIGDTKTTNVRVVLSILSCLLLTSPMAGCSSVPKKADATERTAGITDDAGEKPFPQAPAEYKKGLALLEEEKYADALSVLNDFMIQEPASAYGQAAALNVGRSLEGLGRWAEAAEKYRAVSVACAQVAPRLQALAFYRLSFTYEALADDQQTVAALIDLERRANLLPAQIAQAELPARLAAAYARVGNFDKAVGYYKRAEAGINQLKRAQPDTSGPQWLPRTLYFMGSMSLRHVSWADFESAFRPLARSQTYLLQAAELAADPWSERSAKDLITTYNDLWRTVETAPVAEASDPLVTQRQIQNQQWDRAVLVLEGLTELRARFAPDEATPSSQAKAIHEFVADLEKRINSFLMNRPIGEGLTPEAQKRRNAPRGKVLAPDDSLEKQFIESARGKDPNL